MHFSSETSSNGVIERTFTLDDITGVLWSPETSSGGAPVILAGHPGGLDKKAPGHVARAHSSVLTDGFHVVSIDAPGHGDRPRSPADVRLVTAFQQARAEGSPSFGRRLAEYCHSVAERAVPEWQATINAVQALPEIDARAPIGYSGMTLASAIGIPLAAAEPRITAALFGGVVAHDALLEAAKQVTIPVEFLLPWDDREIPRGFGLELFGAFASEDKVLHAFPGRHHPVPTDRIDTRFFPRHLGRSSTTVAG
ncbi:alpha/beta hydrolase family protein [Mycolicibacterium lutetiense]|uniref:Pimeloyl-ACP methyl ester carboxylesterase n=1 Tax=Mycolicibacterium lutetiense TaxID=1641992 RepID=A0ABS4ZS23_9MYCO|nr:alpha/beta hydrolase [Mycolicibacterium lutetiense]MBP2452300.1 pimeloyl-ACP methyl ester carboxylesterase [Mycolicibacterium lutetiense]